MLLLSRLLSNGEPRGSRTTVRAGQNWWSGAGSNCRPSAFQAAYRFPVHRLGDSQAVRFTCEDARKSRHAMATGASPRSKIPTENPQLARSVRRRQTSPAGDGPRSHCAARPGAVLHGDARAATRGDGGVVVELECGVTVYPARVAGGRWRAVWYENGRRRQCEAASEDRLAAKLEKVTERLAADAPNLEAYGRPPAVAAAHTSRSPCPTGPTWPP